MHTLHSADRVRRPQTKGAIAKNTLAWKFTIYPDLPPDLMGAPARGRRCQPQRGAAATVGRAARPPGEGGGAAAGGGLARPLVWGRRGRSGGKRRRGHLTVAAGRPVVGAAQLVEAEARRLVGDCC